MIRSSWSAMVFVLLFVFAVPLLARSTAVIKAGDFSAQQAGASLPKGWEPFHFEDIKEHTRYQLVKDDGDTVVQANADASASGLIREMSIDPKRFPIIQWRWKVMNILKKGDVRRKEGDDYPARIYIAFQRDPGQMGLFERTKYRIIKPLYGRYPPRAVLNYIWASKEDKGTLVPNPYTDKAMMIVVESGKEKLDRWITEERNYLEDYKRAFGEDPPMISGLAIMTDTDNTRESATAYYGDIVFKPYPKKE